MARPVKLVFQNLAFNKDDSIVRSAIFGPADPNKFRLLIEMDPDSEELYITVGNGPDARRAPEVVSGILTEAARIVSELEDNREYWIAVGREEALSDNSAAIAFAEQYSA